MEIRSDFISHTPYISSYIQPKDASLVSFIINTQLNKKVLVLDLDETLVHSSSDRPSRFALQIKVTLNNMNFTIYVQKRPGADQFLNHLIGRYDVYIFTASLPEYSLNVVKNLFPNIPLSKVLSRHQCRFVQGVLVKDLTIFNRNLKDIIIVDNNYLSFMLQKENGIEIKTWIGDYDDNVLLHELLPFLLQCLEYDDVRVKIGQLYSNPGR